MNDLVCVSDLVCGNLMCVSDLVCERSSMCKRSSSESSACTLWGNVKTRLRLCECTAARTLSGIAFVAYP